MEREYSPSLIVDALKLITFLCLTFGCYEFASVLENREEIKLEEKWNIYDFENPENRIL